MSSNVSDFLKIFLLILCLVFITGEVLSIHKIIIPITGKIDPVEMEENYNPIIYRASRTYGVPATLIKSVIKQESGYNTTAVSPKGALGLMQLMPNTAQMYGVTNPFDPVQNIMAGTCHLKMLLDTYNGNLKLALAAYNSGEGNVNKYRGVPPFSETVDYVKSIIKMVDLKI